MKLKITVILLSLLLLTACSTKNDKKDNDSEKDSKANSFSISYIDEDTDDFDYTSAEQMLGIVFYLDENEEENIRICDSYFESCAAENNIKGDFTNLGHCELADYSYGLLDGYAYAQTPITEDSSFYFVIPDIETVYYCPSDQDISVCWENSKDDDNTDGENTTAPTEEDTEEDITDTEFIAQPDKIEAICMVMRNDVDPITLNLCIGYLESCFNDCGINEEYTYIGKCDNPTADDNSYIKDHLTDGYAFITNSNSGYDYFYYVNPNTKSVYWCGVESEVLLYWKDGKAVDEEAAEDFLYSVLGDSIGDVFYSEANLNGYYEYDCDTGIYTVNFDLTEIHFREDYSSEEQLIHP